MTTINAYTDTSVKPQTSTAAATPSIGAEARKVPSTVNANTTTNLNTETNTSVKAMTTVIDTGAATPLAS